EKRRLVLAVRETPLHVGHLRTLTTLAEIGAVVAPIVPAFYNKPKTVDDIINHTVGRLLDLFGIETKTVKRWEGGPAEERFSKEDNEHGPESLRRRNENAPQGRRRLLCRQGYGRRGRLQPRLPAH